MIKFLSGLVVVAFSIIAIFIPSLKKKNEELEKENHEKDSLIKSVKNVEEIKTKNSKLSKSDLISGM